MPLEDIANYKLSKLRKGIPRIVHHVWLGIFDPPLDWMKSWKDDFCPNHGWRYKLWREKDIAEMGLVNQDAFDKSVSYQQKSDIARYEIIYKHGGLYMDVDMIYLGNNLDDYLPMDTADFIGVQESPSSAVNIIGPPYCANGFFAATAKHPILKKMIDQIPSRINMKTNHSFIKTGPTLFNSCITSPIVLLNHHWVFPLDFHFQHGITDPRIFKDKALTFTKNGNEYPHLKKLKNLEKFGNCSGGEC